MAETSSGLPSLVLPDRQRGARRPGDSATPRPLSDFFAAYTALARAQQRAANPLKMYTKEAFLSFYRSWVGLKRELEAGSRRAARRAAERTARGPEPQTVAHAVDTFKCDAVAAGDPKRRKDVTWLKRLVARDLGLIDAGHDAEDRRRRVVSEPALKKMERSLEAGAGFHALVSGLGEGALAFFAPSDGRKVPVSAARRVPEKLRRLLRDRPDAKELLRIVNETVVMPALQETNMPASLVRRLRAGGYGRPSV